MKDAVSMATKAKSFGAARSAIKKGFSTKSLKGAGNAFSLALQVGFLGGWYESEDWSSGLEFAVSASNFDQEFREALAALRTKTAVPTTTWRQASGAIQNRAFTVAGMTRAEMLQSVLNSLERALDDGLSFSEWNKLVEADMTSMGWSESGWRRNLIYRQNTDWAFAAGRHEQQSELIASNPDQTWFRIYKHGGSANPRPHHLALNNLVLTASDPAWGSIMPPNGFNCSCVTYLLTESDVRASGLRPASLTDTAPIVDPLTGNSIEVPAVRVNGELTPIPAPGFNYTPMAMPMLPPDLDPVLARSLDQFLN